MSLTDEFPLIFFHGRNSQPNRLCASSATGSACLGVLTAPSTCSSTYVNLIQVKDKQRTISLSYRLQCHAKVTLGGSEYFQHHTHHPAAAYRHGQKMVTYAVREKVDDADVTMVILRSPLVIQSLAALTGLLSSSPPINTSLFHQRCCWGQGLSTPADFTFERSAYTKRGVNADKAAAIFAQVNPTSAVCGKCSPPNYYCHMEKSCFWFRYVAIKH